MPTNLIKEDKYLWMKEKEFHAAVKIDRVRIFSGEGMKRLLIAWVLMFTRESVFSPDSVSISEKVKIFDQNVI